MLLRVSRAGAPRERPPTHAAAGLQHVNGNPAHRERACGYEAREPRADHDGVNGPLSGLAHGGEEWLGAPRAERRPGSLEQRLSVACRWGWAQNGLPRHTGNGAGATKVSRRPPVLQDGSHADGADSHRSCIRTAGQPRAGRGGQDEHVSTKRRIDVAAVPQGNRRRGRSREADPVRAAPLWRRQRGGGAQGDRQGLVGGAVAAARRPADRPGVHPGDDPDPGRGDPRAPLLPPPFLLRPAIRRMDS